MSIRNLEPAPCKQVLDDLKLLGHMRSYAKGDRLFTLSNALDRIYIVEKGIVMLMSETEKGSLITGYRQPGDIIGAEDFLLGGERPSGLTATCRTACSIAEVSFEVLNKTAHTEMLALLGRAAASAAKNALCQSQDLATAEIKDRLWSTLNTLTKLPTSVTHPKGIKISHTRKELALAVNTSRETVGRLIHALENEGALSREGHGLVIHYA